MKLGLEGVQEKVIHSRHLLKNGRAGLIEDHHVGVGTTAMGFCCRKENGLNSEYEKNWDFIAKEQSRGSVDGKLLRKHQG